MEFKASLDTTHDGDVTVNPDSQKGFFQIDGGPENGGCSAATISLWGVGKLDLFWLRRQRQSVMDHYVVEDPEQPGVISFVNCRAIAQGIIGQPGYVVDVSTAQEMPAPTAAQVE